MGRAARFRLCDEIEAGVAGNKRLYLGIRNTDEDDGFRMFHQPDANDLRILVHRHQGMDGLTGIAGRSHEIRGNKDPRHRLAALQHRGRRHIITHSSETVRTRHKIRGCGGRQKLLQYRCRAGGYGAAQAEAEQKDKTEEFHSKVFSRNRWRSIGTLARDIR
ncbi:hypothetical protein D9M70_459640 [compost metagenome]